MTPPIRFLALVVGGWAILRVLVHLPGDEVRLIGPPPAEARTVVATPSPVKLEAWSISATRRPGALVLAKRVRHARPAMVQQAQVASRGGMIVQSVSVPLVVPSVALALPMMQPRLTGNRESVSPTPAAEPPLTGVRPKSRLSGSAWMLARGGDVAAVASNGLLGGSQAGARLLYRVNDDEARPLSLTVRATSPLRREGVEAALGVEWQPFAGVPVRFLAERRQRVSGDGRSAFALLVHGGVSDRPVAGGLRLDAYAQAGVVGARSRDLFADAGATLVRPIGAGGLAVGAGAWGGVQPGAARLDVGPRLTTTIAAADRRARVSLDWRFRVAGASAPASGPSLTVGTDF